MTIATLWKNYIKQYFEWCEMSSEASQSITTVIDDLSLNIRRILAGAQSWEHLSEIVRNRVLLLAKRGTVREYWLTLDEGRFVPENKRVVHRDREASACDPFTEEECSHITIGHGSLEEQAALFRISISDFFQKLMATRSLHGSLYTFITSELATMDLPENMTLCLDGVRAQGIVERMLRVKDRCQTQHSPKCELPECQYHVNFMNIKIPKHIYEASSPITQGRLEHPSILRISRSTDNKGNNIYMRETRGIGESDLKIPAIVADQPAGSQIFVRSCDGDMLPIFLLHMRNYICTEQPTENEAALGVKYGYCKYGIYIDTEGPGRKLGSEPVPVLDIVQVWRCIHRKFHEKYVSVPYAAETLAVLMLLSGSDYADSLPRIGPGAVWKAFTDPNGRALLFPNDNPRNPAVCIDDVRGQPDTRIGVRLEERRFLAFISYMYHTIGTKHEPFVNDPRHVINNVMRIRKDAASQVVLEGKKPTSANSWLPPTVEQLQASVRRLAWNFDYFTNGSKRSPFLNPIFQVEGTGESLHGWWKDPETGRIERAEHVYMV